MAQWSSGVMWNSGNLWGPSATPAGPVNANTNTHPTKMKRDTYYPRRASQRPEWHGNFAAKLQTYGPGLGLTATQVDNAVADNLILAFGLGDWINNVREYAPACTASLADLRSGTGVATYVFPACAAPALPTLPVGITGVLPGALDRTFKLVQEIKAKPGYTEAIGLDMGIVGSEAPAPPPGDPTPPRH